MKSYAVVLLSFALLSGFPITPAAQQPLGLESIESERNLEKRARKALDYAHETVGRVVDAYREGDSQLGSQLLGEIQDAVELAQESLKATGKNPFKKPKSFKRAEIETRKLLRELDEIEKELSFDEREPLEEVRARVSKINEDLLAAIFTKKKK